MINWPNQITISRVVLLPIFLICFYIPSEWGRWLSVGIFVLASITDWLDGYLARKLNQHTPFGAFLDPLADKLMVATALVVLVGLNGTAFLAIPAVVIVGREIMVSALREWMAELGQRAVVKVSMLGKVKTTMQMIAIILLLFLRGNQDFGDIFVVIAYFSIYIAAILTLLSMLIYVKAAWPILLNGTVTEKKDNKA